MEKKIIALALTLTMILFLSGCDIASWSSTANDIKGQLVGVSFECQFYDNYGELFLTASGEKIGLTGNVIRESTISSTDGSTSREYILSSVVTINIDGKQIQSCGDTIIFAETGLKPDAEFALSDINSQSSGALSENTFFYGTVNHYKNYFGKPQVVVIQSQLGIPICAYSGDDVYWEVREDLPKTTKLMIDGKALYIHRANFQIIDRELIKQEGAWINLFFMKPQTDTMQ